ncbi:MAG TPA: tetratricopeptide repeat protein [Sediminispirochaeta sp.]|nr:tetratricopeptide repeat protein [Sediminispirochaeta sp.]
MRLPRGERYRRLLFFTLIILILSTSQTLLWSQQEEDTAVELYQRGAQLLSGGEIYRAIDNFRESVSMNPNYLEPLFGLAKAYFRLEEYPQALDYVEEARMLARSDLSVAALHGRILTGMGRYDEARRLFEAHLQETPYHRDLLFGLAELRVATGNIELALESYRNALSSDPHSRKGLLAAALLYSAQDRSQEAGKLIRTAVDLYPEDLRVQASAARFYYDTGELERAETHARQALSLEAADREALRVLIRLFFEQQRYEELVSVLEQAISLDRHDHLLWHLQAKAFWETGGREAAFESFKTAMDLRPSDELNIIVMEEFLMREYPPDSPQRRQAAELRFAGGRSYERNNRVELARQEYRRGLVLAPYHQEGRVLYANTYKRSGNLGKYLSVLEVLENNERTTEEIRDEIEIYRHMRENGLAERWGVDQFFLDRPRYRLGLYDLAGDSSLIHQNSEEHIREYIRFLIQGYEHVEIVGNAGVESFAEAFGRARESGADYFAILFYTEDERSFRSRMEVYSASTGALVRPFSSTRTGNNRVGQSLLRTVGSLVEAFPIRGTIYRREGASVLLDIGKFQGLEEGDKLLVISPEELNIADASFRLEYNEEELLGEVEINEVDDLLSEATVSTYQFFDLINPGDMVFRAQEPLQEAGDQVREDRADTSVENNEIYRSIRGIE